LLVVLVALILAGAGIGAWLATRGSSSSPSAQDVQTSSRLLTAGVQAQLKGNDAVAANDYLRSVSLNPKAKAAWYDLGLLEQKKGFASEAERDYERAVAIDPRYVPALYNLGTVVAPSDPSSAVKLYEKVIAIDPSVAAAHFNLGFALQKLGKLAEGNAQISEGVRLDPSLASRLPGSAATPPAPGAP
jgi:tetratricopeptide (TPR) repeat protein